MRRKYNACYRLREKGFSISSKSKTILPPQFSTLTQR